MYASSLTHCLFKSTHSVLKNDFSTLVVCTVNVVAREQSRRLNSTMAHQEKDVGVHNRHSRVVTMAEHPYDCSSETELDALDGVPWVPTTQTTDDEFDCGENDITDANDLTAEEWEPVLRQFHDLLPKYRSLWRSLLAKEDVGGHSLPGSVKIQTEPVGTTEVDAAAGRKSISQDDRIRDSELAISDKELKSPSFCNSDTTVEPTAPSMFQWSPGNSTNDDDTANSFPAPEDQDDTGKREEFVVPPCDDGCNCCPFTSSVATFVPVEYLDENKKEQSSRPDEPNTRIHPTEASEGQNTTKKNYEIKVDSPDRDIDENEEDETEEQEDESEDDGEDSDESSAASTIINFNHISFTPTLDQREQAVSIENQKKYHSDQTRNSDTVIPGQGNILLQEPSVRATAPLVNTKRGLVENPLEASVEKTTPDERAYENAEDDDFLPVKEVRLVHDDREIVSPLLDSPVDDGVVQCEYRLAQSNNAPEIESSLDDLLECESDQEDQGIEASSDLNDHPGSCQNKSSHPKKPPALALTKNWDTIDLVDSDTDTSCSAIDKEANIRESRRRYVLVDSDTDESSSEVDKKTNVSEPRRRYRRSNTRGRPCFSPRLKFESDDDEFSVGDTSSEEVEFDGCLSSGGQLYDFADGIEDENSSHEVGLNQIIDLIEDTKIDDDPKGRGQFTPARPRENTKKHSKKGFLQDRERLTADAFAAFDSQAFGGRLKGKVDFLWSKTLRKTAGTTTLKKDSHRTCEGRLVVTRHATIKLSTKVLDDSERLRSTLLHELCHAAAWLVDDVSKPPHGKCFKKWARQAMRVFPDILVSTYHDYDISFKYAWACQNNQCGVIIQRHSRSVDVNKHVCGKCRNRLMEIEVPTGTRSSSFEPTPRKKAPLSDYNRFIKESSSSVRERLAFASPAGVVTQSDVMKECARLWNERKSKV